MGFLDTILQILFPVRCLVCGKGSVQMCRTCRDNCPPAERESAEWIFPLYDYRHPPIQKALHALKYKGQKNLAEVFGEALYEKILEELSELMLLQNFSDPFLIPIPLSPKGRRERGFNQAELLSRHILRAHRSRALGAPEVMLELAIDVLVKPKHTEHQARLKNRRERLENIAGSFAVADPARIRGRNVILIDDILTTGATLGEARRVLKKAGARKIVAFTVAH